MENLVNHKIELTLHVEPKPKKRPRFKYINGLSRVFVDAKERDAAAELEFEIRYQYSEKPLTGPLRVDVQAYFVRAKSNKDIHHIKRPDLDNLEKFIWDVCNGILWIDDCQIVESSASKAYADQDYWKITVLQL